MKGSTAYWVQLIHLAMVLDWLFFKPIPPLADVVFPKNIKTVWQTNEQKNITKTLHVISISLSSICFFTVSKRLKVGKISCIRWKRLKLLISKNDIRWSDDFYYTLILSFLLLPSELSKTWCCSKRVQYLKKMRRQHVKISWIQKCNNLV